MPRAHGHDVRPGAVPPPSCDGELEEPAWLHVQPSSLAPAQADEHFAGDAPVWHRDSVAVA